MEIYSEESFVKEFRMTRDEVKGVCTLVLFDFMSIHFFCSWSTDDLQRFSPQRIHIIRYFRSLPVLYSLRFRPA